MDIDEKQDRLHEVLEAMLIGNLTISARAICRHAPETFPHASSITTVERRQKLMANYIAKQELVRGHVGSGLSKVELEREREISTQRITELEHNQALLASGLKAAILTITSMGGFSIWAAHYSAYEAATQKLRALGALPAADILRGPGIAR